MLFWKYKEKYVELSAQNTAVSIPSTPICSTLQLNVICSIHTYGEHNLFLAMC